jgi:hypothetical protein
VLGERPLSSCSDRPRIVRADRCDLEPRTRTLGITFQPFPSKCSISVWPDEFLLPRRDMLPIKPTAQTSLAEVADTASSSGSTLLFGVGRTTGDQDVPL